MKFERIVLIVLDSVGIGELPDAERYGDLGAHTLAHILQETPNLTLPHLQHLGLGNIAPLPHLKAVKEPKAYFGKMAEVSAGKDTMTGHWELAGLKVDIPFQTYPQGFPEPLIQAFEQKTGRKVIGNKVASGTEIIAELGEQQMQSGAWIVYTSADSVFQIAAHEEIIPLEELYRACKIARELTLREPYAVGRVIARPYIGKPGHFERTANRHDYALKPPQPTVLHTLKEKGLDCIAIGKINDIFSGEGITKAFPTKDNADGIQKTIAVMESNFQGLCFTNLVDFDSKYGHRRDPKGYAHALKAFDDALPTIQQTLTDKDLLIITADHGNDPTHTGTDHTREYVPLLVWNPKMKRGRSLGVRSTFSDVGATIAHNFGVKLPDHGTSFLSHIDE